MALLENDLLGNETDKVKRDVDMLKMSKPNGIGFADTMIVWAK